MSLSLYRTYRPNVFADVVGQEHVEQALARAAREGTVAHAYLFCGPRGTGKTTTARLLAKALNCEAGPENGPDGTCAQCRAIAQATHPDVYELDAASRTGVDNVREEIIGRVDFAPTIGRRKVYIIDEVHMLSKGAFNALLKTLEEPPEHVVFILCTTEARKVPDTIQSRCQRFDFRLLSDAEIVSYLERICLAESFEYEREALEQLAARSSGGMRDATTALEQVAVYADGSITQQAIGALFGQLGHDSLFELVGHIARRDGAACLQWLDTLVRSGADIAQFAAELASHLRNLYAVALCGAESEVVAGSKALRERYRQQAGEFGGVQRLARAMTVAGELVQQLRTSTNMRLSVELALARLCLPQSDLTLEALAERVEALEAGATPPTRQEAHAAETLHERGQDAPAEQPPSFAPAHEARRTKHPQEGEGIALEQAVRIELEREREMEDACEPQRQDDAPDEAPDETPAPAITQPDDMTPARLLAAVLAVVSREDMATGALLQDVELDVSGSTCTLLFAESAEFSMRIVSGQQTMQLLTRAFEEVLGSQVTLRCRLQTAAPGPEAPPAAQNTPLQPRPAQRQAPSPAPENPTAPDGGQENDAARSRDPDDARDAQPAPAPQRQDDASASDLAGMLSVFGDGVTVQELDS